MNFLGGFYIPKKSTYTSPQDLIPTHLVSIPQMWDQLKTSAIVANLSPLQLETSKQTNTSKRNFALMQEQDDEDDDGDGGGDHDHDADKSKVEEL